jgi:DNA-binding MarR family transcriptional regulator
LTTRIEKTRGCLNFQLRRTSREVSRYYDDALRPLGLRISQFNILAILAQTGPISVTDLGNILGMERSALARNLKPIAREGFVVVSQGEDRRTRLAKLAPAGKRKLDAALPRWNRAQNELVAKFGPDQAALLIEVLSRIRAALNNGG